MDCPAAPSVGADDTHRQATEATPAAARPAIASEGVWDKATLSAHQIRVSAALKYNLERLAAKNGVQTLGFVTLTFANPEPSIQEASKRFRRLKRKIIQKSCPGGWICVPERAPGTNRLHLHLVGAFDFDLADGFDHEAYLSGRKGIKRRMTTNPRLRAEWALWRVACQKCDFGHPEGPVPLRKEPGALSWYLAGYLTKSFVRLEEDRSAKMVLYGGNTRRATTRTTANSETARNWRKQLDLWATVLFGPGASLDDFHQHFGSQWAIILAPILSMDPLDCEVEYELPQVLTDRRKRGRSSQGLEPVTHETTPPNSDRGSHGSPCYGRS